MTGVITRHVPPQRLIDLVNPVVEVTHAGRRVPMHADLDEQPASVATTLHAVIDRIGPKAARSQLGLTIAGDGTPSVGELEEAVGEYDLAIVTLTEPVQADAPAQAESKEP